MKIFQTAENSETLCYGFLFAKLYVQ